MRPTMKTVFFMFAPFLVSTVTVAELNNTQTFGTHEVNARFFEDPSIKACCYHSTPSSEYWGEDVIAGTMVLLQSVSFKESLVSVRCNVFHLLKDTMPVSKAG